MVTATNERGGYLTRLSDGKHVWTADVPRDRDGTDAGPTPTDLLLSAYAACINITARMLLDEGNYPYKKVDTRVELERTAEGKARFYFHTDIEGDISESDKAALLKRVERCPVCKLLAAEKEFLPLE